MLRPNSDIRRGAVRGGAVVDRRAMLVGSAAVAVPLAEPDASEASTDADHAPNSLQFQESEHVRQFYAKCRF